MAKPLSGSTAPSLGTRSRTWPYEARTVKSLPRYLLIVLALAGDSTMRRFLAMEPARWGDQMLEGPTSKAGREGNARGLGPRALVWIPLLVVSRRWRRCQPSPVPGGAESRRGDHPPGALAHGFRVQCTGSGSSRNIWVSIQA